VSAPCDQYLARLDARCASVASFESADARIANLRLVVFVIGIAVAVASFGFELVGGVWLLAPAAGFLALVVWHASVIEQLARACGAVAHYQRALMRLDGTWPGTGNQRTNFVDDDHPFAADLDLFGAGSLFELLCNARTRAGEQALAAWLAAPADPAEVVARQVALDELRERLDLREDLALLGGEVREGVHPEALIAWGERPPVLSVRAALFANVAAWALPAALCAATVAWVLAWVGPWPLLALAAFEWAVLRVLKAPLESITARSQQPEEELLVLARVLDRLEREPMASPRLQQLRDQLVADGVIASKSIRRLERLMTWLAAQRNQAFAPIAFVLLWSVHFGLAIERWRARKGGEIRRWLRAVGELEALCDLACYAYEHPADPFPEVVDPGPLFAGEDLGHPLLDDEVCVRNSVELGPEARALMVSGSNMSGKTTLLRTVGINVVLAFAGAPVRARGLKLSPLAVGATIRIHDSIQEGRSRFYTEIRRLRALKDLSRGELPLLFLLDEVLHGTNSADRRVGAEAILRDFIDAGSIGLVTTHDLALAEVADVLAPRAANVHFADTLVDGELVFDYTMHPGVVERSNALALMRSVGLDV